MELRSTREMRRNEQLTKAMANKTEGQPTAAQTKPAQSKAQPPADKLSLSRQALSWLEEQNRKLWEQDMEREQRRQDRMNDCLSSMESKKKELDAMGFVRSYTFYGGSTVTVIDEQNANIALLFRFNPFCPYIFPASRVKKAWTDDGRMGKGLMEGSSQVSFIMLIGRTKIRVYTFTSNRRFTMNSDQILTGISKADLVVEILKNAHDKRKGMVN